MAAVYPGVEAFTPDVLAALDVEQPDDDQRLAWAVVDEGKGVDLALEVLHRGNRKKDLVDNVERYASLGITEYFVYDYVRQQIHGYRLPDPSARRYQRIVPQSGRYHSAVLGLDLVLQGGSLRFYHGMAELIASSDLIERLTGMVESLEARAEQAEAKAEQAEAKVEQAEARVEQALASTRESVLAVLDARGIVLADDTRARLAACDDLAALQRWLVRAVSAASAADVFSEP